MAGGLTNQGYVATTVDEEVTDLNQKFLANIDGGLDLSPDQPFGQVIGIFAEKYAELTEAIATIYNSINPAAAEGNLLDNVCAITGTFRQVATYSFVDANLTLSAGTTVTAGSTVSVLNQPANVWVLTADVTNSGTGTASLPGVFRSQQPGPFVANAGTLTVIGTPTVGWSAVTNPTDAIPGVAADTDAQLRAKRNTELLGQGSGDLDAIRAAVLKIGEGIEACFAYENTGWTYDPTTGLPPKSFRVVIWDGVGMSASNNDIAQAIWDNKPAGILPFGTSSGNAVDSLGNTRIVPFDRAQQVPIYIAVTTNVALTGAQTSAVKAALAAFALADWNLNVSIVWNTLFAPVQSVIGIGSTLKITSLTVGTSPSPSGTADIPIGLLQIATLSTTNITVNGV